jgi:hypothetical protein
MDIWNPAFVERMPLLSPLGRFACKLNGDDWPATALLQQLLNDADVRVASGRPLQLVPAGGKLPYEIRVHESAELEVRERNWHDFFNVLVWLMFPRAKAALNARHYAAWPVDSGDGRGAVRDALTLFDESGLVVISAQPALLQLIRNFEWKSLFWTQRAAVAAGMRFLPFGHALCEKALSPYRGMTGHALLLEVDATWLALEMPELISRVDRRLEVLVADPQSMQTTRQLSPLPVLGVPGWCWENECADYYDDTRYFRPGRRAAAAGA